MIVLILFAAVVSFVSSWEYINILACYFSIHDIGINNAANAGGLLFFTFPTAFLLQLIFTTVFIWCLRKYIPSLRTNTLLQGATVFILSLLFLVLFAEYELAGLRDYPNTTNRTGTLFELLSSVGRCSR